MESADEADRREGEQDGGQPGGGGEGEVDGVPLVAAPPQSVPESESQDQLSLQLADVAPDPHPDLSLMSEYSFEDPTSEVLAHQFSNLYVPEDMGEQEPLTGDEELEEDEVEEEEFTVLAPEHPLYRTRQAAMKRLLQAHKERLSLTLKEKLRMQKENSKKMQDSNCQMFNKLELLGIQHKKLSNCLEAKEQGEVRHQEAQAEVQSANSREARTSKEHSTVRTIVSCLQKDLDHLSQSQLTAKKACEELSSQVQIMRNVTDKGAAERVEAEEQKGKQDFYVERLTKSLEKLTEEKAMYEAQTRAQAEEAQAVKGNLSEADMDMEILMMAYRQLIHQWNNSLSGMRKQDEAFNAMQEAARDIEHQVILLQMEIEGCKKSTNKEEEQNETLTMQLRWSEMDCTSTKKLIGHKQTQRDALQAHYSTCLCTLQETERTLETLTKEASALKAELKDQRKRKEKNCSIHLELENKIMTHLQEQLTHSNTAKYAKRLTDKTAVLRIEKMILVEQQENEVLAVKLANQEIDQEVDYLELSTQALEKEVAVHDHLLTVGQKKLNSYLTTITQQQALLVSCKKRIEQMVASTEQDNMSPFKVKVRTMTAHIEALAAKTKLNKQLWMKQQEILFGLTEEMEVNSRDTLKLQTEATARQQQQIRLRSLIESVHREQSELQVNSDILHRDRTKLSGLISKNEQLHQAVEEENRLMETDIIGRLKEAEWESIRLQVKHEKMQEDQDLILRSLQEVEQQILLWGKRTQLMMETRVAVEKDIGQKEMKILRTEIHHMEVGLSQLMKLQAQLVRESEVTVERFGNILRRGEVPSHSSPKKPLTKDALNLNLRGLHRQIQDAQKLLTESAQVIVHSQQKQGDVGNRLMHQRHRVTEQHGTSCILDSKQATLHDSRDMMGVHLVLLQNRCKKLQKVCDGKYQATSTRESVEGAVQELVEHLHAVSTVLHQVCEASPQHQGELRRLSESLATHTQNM